MLSVVKPKLMITSAEEFIRLRNSDIKEEQVRADRDSADALTWIEVINRFPEYKTWVIHNKTVPTEILEMLAKDDDAGVRSEVARKRKINDKIFDILAVDKDETVRHALICNTKLAKEKKMMIDTSTSEWLAKALRDQMAQAD